MIQFQRFVLANGLRVLIHEDHSTPMAVLNVMYDVGARDEDPARTGFAHLFEHLMFGGSQNVPDFDEPLQMAGGENNAYTTNDLTNYYIQLPAENLPTALWLESDRMLGLAFSKKSLDVQRKVVCEEFKEHYINRPYGDVWHLMRKLAYTTHPYRWMTIGAELSHIEEAQLTDVKAFFAKHYNPVNAIVVVAGHVQTDEALRQVEEWFGDIPAGEKYQRSLPTEPEQQQARRQVVEADVPVSALYKCWHMGHRTSPGYYAADLITEIMGSGASSRLHQSLVKEQKLFNTINCYHMGSADEGLMTIEGRLAHGVSLEQAEAAVMAEVNKLLADGVTEKELQKAKNKAESLMAYEDMSLMNRANSLAFYELLGDAGLMNLELDRFQQTTREQLMAEAQRIFREENSNTLWYVARQPQAGAMQPVLAHDDEEEDGPDEA